MSTMGSGTLLQHEPWANHQPVRRLIGRTDELRTIAALIAALREGMSFALVVGGELGVGTSTLLNHVMASATDFEVASVAGVESEMELPFAGLHRLLRPYLSRLDRLTGRQRSALESAFGLADHGSPERFLVGLGALTLLAEVATERPLLCVVDDFQWLDQESADVMAFVARRLMADRIGFLIAVQRDLGDPRSLDGLRELTLRPLDRAHAQELLMTAFGDGIDASVRDRIVAETGGNPLSVLELAAGLTPDQLGGKSALPDPLPAGEPVQERYRQITSSLPPATRTLLVLAAAYAREDPALFWGAAHRLGLGPEALAPAEQRGLLRVSPTVVFPHPQFRSAAYSSATLSERRHVHQALAAVLDAALEPVRRARHRAAATVEPDEEVAAELVSASEAALKQGGYSSSASLLSRAAELTPAAAVRAQRLLAAARAWLTAGAIERSRQALDGATTGLTDPLQHAVARTVEAERLFWIGPPGQALAIFVEAGRAIAPINPALARETLLDACTAALWSNSPGDWPLLKEIMGEVTALPRPPAFPVGPIDYLFDAYATLIAAGFVRAAPLLKRAVSSLFADDLEPAERLRWSVLGWSAAAYLFDEAALHAVASAYSQLARELGALRHLETGLAALAFFKAHGGRLAEAESLAAQAREMSMAINNSQDLGCLSQALVLGLRGHEAAARQAVADQTKQGVQRGERIRVFFARYALVILELGRSRYQAALDAAMLFEDDPGFLGTWVLPDLIEAAVRCGQHELAQSALRRLRERAEASGTALALGLLARSRALIAADEDAEGLYQESIETLGRSALPPERARANLLYGEWLRRQSRRLDARRQLRAAYDELAAIGMDAFAERARIELLATGAHARKRRVETQEDLTPQETQVARLAGTGARNQEIAAQLYISPSTVEYHLTKVFRKLGVTTRTELARIILTAEAPVSRTATVLRNV